MDFISKLRLKAAQILSPSISPQMQKAYFQWLGNDAVVYPDDFTSYIKNGYNSNLFVYMVVSYISRQASSIPWVLKRELPDGSYQTINDHELYKVIERPNGLYNFKEYVEQALGFYLLTGNTYTHTIKVGAKKERLKEVYVLPANYINIVSSGNYMKPIKYYEFDLYKDLKFDSNQVIHTKMANYSWANGEVLYGQSPLKAGLRTLEGSNSNITAMKSQAANQGARGLLMFDRENGTSTLTEPQMRAFEREMKRKVNNADTVGTIQTVSKMFKYQQLGMSAKDMELLDMHKVSKQDICSLYGLSSLLFNDNSNSTYNNINEVKKSAYTDSILPYLQALMDEWNNSIVAAYDSNLAFYPDTSKIDVLQADKEKQVKWLKDAYWISNQRKQEKMEEKTDNSLPSYLLPTSLVPSAEIEINNAFNAYVEPNQ